MVDTTGVSSMEEMAITIERLPVLPHEPWSGPLEIPSSSSSSTPGHVHHHNNKSSRLVRGVHPAEMGAPSHDKFRRRQAKKEILRRALTPPARRPTLRWLDFRPTPSRLRTMSTE